MQHAGAFSLKRMLILLVPCLAIGSYLYWYNLQSPARARSGDQRLLIKKLGIGQIAATELSAGFEDADGDLVADPPGDPDQFIAPDPIVFSYIPSMGAGEKRSLWDEFTAEMATALGTAVEVVAFTDPEKHLAAFSNGDLHVTAFNTGMVPRAVASGGFVPVCTLGQQDGSFGYTMKLIVRADSDIQSPADLANHRLTFTRLNSNSGYKAAVVMLMQKHNLLPERDYEWQFSFGHFRSMEGIVDGQYEVAAVAGDLLDRQIAQGIIDGSQVRTIYESEKFPPAALGYAYNLAPELAQGVRSFLANYELQDDSELGEEFAAAGHTKFVPIRYQEDWKGVREIDRELAVGRE